jgi:hypothetical protein
MPSSYTTNGGITKPATGELSGTWGTTTNLNFDILDRLINGVGPIVLSGTAHSLSTSDGSLSEGQFPVLVLGGSPSGTNTITILPNDAQKLYFVVNSSGQSAVFTQGAGASVTVLNGDSAIIFADGAGAGAVVRDFTATFGPYMFAANNLSDLASAATARANLGLEIGTNVLAYDSNLQAFLDTFSVPSSDGTAGQVLTTDGAGNLTFTETANNSTAFALALIFN